MASTAPLMAASAAGGTPPGSMTTSGREAAHVTEDMPSKAASHTRRDTMKSAFAGDHRGREGGTVFRQNRHVGSQGARNGMVRTRHFAIGFRHHGGATGIGLAAYAHLQRQRTQPWHMVLRRHVAAPMFTENMFGVTAIRADVDRHILDYAQYRHVHLLEHAQPAPRIGKGKILGRDDDDCTLH